MDSESTEVMVETQAAELSQVFEGTRAASWSKTNWLFTGSHQAEDPPGGASNNQQGTTSRNTNDWHLALASPDIL